MRGRSERWRSHVESEGEYPVVVEGVVVCSWCVLVLVVVCVSPSGGQEGGKEGVSSRAGLTLNVKEESKSVVCSKGMRRVKKEREREREQGGEERGDSEE